MASSPSGLSTAHRSAPAERRAIVLSLVVGAALMAVKFIAYFLTGSSAIFSDALESIVNVVAAAVALASVALAHRPPDRNHPYGHGKIEFLSAGLEGGMILVAAVVILFKTLDAVINNRVGVDELGWGLALVGFAGLVNLVMGLRLRSLGRQRDSLTLEADGQHLLTDAVTSAVAIVALLAVRFLGWAWADPLAACAVAFFIGTAGIRLLRRSYAGLMDQQDQGDTRLIEGILIAHSGPAGKPPRICSYHKLRHRHSGRYHWVDFHIALDPALSVAAGHAVASNIEWEIEQALGEGNATAHVEPCAEPGCRHGAANVPAPQAATPGVPSPSRADG